jgi:hypothetical protein
MSELMLPSNFVRGYFKTLSSAWGQSNLLLAINLIVENQRSINNDIETTANLLRDIQFERIAIIPSLPYHIVRLIFVGLELAWNKQARDVRAHTFIAGRDWWLGGQYEVGLDFTLFDLINFADFEPQKTLWWNTTCEVIQAFSDRLAASSGIQIDVEITDAIIIIRFPVCPFCIEQSEHCELFRGIIYSLLVWLFAKSHSPDKYEFGWLNIIDHSITLTRRS